MATFHSQKAVEIDLSVLRIAISTADFAHLAFHTFNLKPTITVHHIICLCPLQNLYMCIVRLQ